MNPMHHATGGAPDPTAIIRLSTAYWDLSLIHISEPTRPY